MRFYEETMGVYFDDLDPLQILHNARYLLLFERTLGGFWMQIGAAGFQDPDDPDRIHLVVANNIAYHAPVRGVGRVRVRVWIHKVGRTSLTFAFRLMPLDQDLDHATGTRTIVRVDPKTLQPVPWSEAFRARTRPYEEATP